MRKLGTVAVLIVWLPIALLIVGEIDRHALGHKGALRAEAWIVVAVLYALGAVAIVRWRRQKHRERMARRASLNPPPV